MENVIGVVLGQDKSLDGLKVSVIDGHMVDICNSHDGSRYFYLELDEVTQMINLLNKSYKKIVEG